MLYRKIESLIEEHLKSDSKKILLIDGARQIGKTYIINHVGKKLFENYIEINMIADSLVEAMGVEPMSKNQSVSASPSADISLNSLTQALNVKLMCSVAPNP